MVGETDLMRAAGQRFNGVVASNSVCPSNMVWIPGGTFVMGSPTSEVWLHYLVSNPRYSDEVQHTVRVSGFYISRYEVTQGEYLAVVGRNPSYFRNGVVPHPDDFVRGTGRAVTDELRHPVERVTWHDAMKYCYLLNRREGRLGSGWKYRLPTESEWEYACRAGTSTPFHYGPDLVSGMANFDGGGEYIGGVGIRENLNGVYLGRTSEVGSYEPNAFGLYDMHGNVWEWCLDWYGSYPTGSVVNPRGPRSGSERVMRGASWHGYADSSRSAKRSRVDPSFRATDVGFRPVLAPGQ